MLAGMRIGREEQQRAGRRQHEHDADGRFLHVVPAAVGPREKQRSEQRRAQCTDLHRAALRLEARPAGEHDTDPCNLSNREIDEDDAAIQHLNAQWNMRCGHENPGRERGPQDAPVEHGRTHGAAASSRAIVSSNKPKRSRAFSVPPTV
jgi:hypothetical protein